MHEHDKECEHELKHCPHCDVVYCEKCGKEWGKKETVYIAPTTYPPYRPYDPISPPEPQPVPPYRVGDFPPFDTTTTVGYPIVRYGVGVGTSGHSCSIASENVLSRDWLTDAEDTAWASLGLDTGG